MRGKRAASQSATGSDCAARPMVDLHDIFITLSSGGVIPALVVLNGPVGSESTPSFVQTVAASVIHLPLGPPPRA